MTPVKTQETGRSRLGFRRISVWLFIFASTLLLVSVLALVFGAQKISLSAIFEYGTIDRTIVLGVRLPRVALGLLVGGALGAAGATLQAILRNPLADPFVLGVSGGAALGATLAIVAGTVLSTLGLVSITPDSFTMGIPISVAAAAGALASTFLMLLVARSGGRIDPYSMLLAGVVFNAFAAAAILFLRTMVTPDQAHALLPWLVGNLAHKSWPAIGATALLIAFALALLLLNAVKLNLLSLGDETAYTLGVNVEQLRFILIITLSLMIGASVSLAGLIGFVGLVVPHIIRIVLGPDHRLLLPSSILLGGAFLVGCDLLARVAFVSVGTELPVGVVTAMIGAPLFLILLKRNTSH